MNIWGWLLKKAGWKVDISVPPVDKCVICVAPHTSNWDFILGLFAYRSIGRKANFLMKDFWFFFPLGYIIRALGGIPVHRSKGGTSLTQSIVNDFNCASQLHLAVTPEGTRSRTNKWKTGFLYIAYGAHVPIMLGVIDYSRRLVAINRIYNPEGNIDIDMNNIRKFYAGFTKAAKFPDKFAP
ncbi:MAG: 1-acyl-sn-glycerol-3-phosphate acyltransferase [Muribaculaceae bacterium]|nr:1-acyl-sn-glycerol-3-phosphate acyltransferase [Muribaculaceae bacterium]